MLNSRKGGGYEDRIGLDLRGREAPAQFRAKRPLLRGPACIQQDMRAQGAFVTAAFVVAARNTAIRTVSKKLQNHPL